MVAIILKANMFFSGYFGQFRQLLNAARPLFCALNNVAPDTILVNYAEHRNTILD